MYLLKKRVFISAFILMLGLAFITNPAEAQENSQATLSGKVVDSASQQALNDIDVKILGLDKTATTDKEGMYSFESLAIGSYTIVVKAEGYQDWKKEVEVTKNGKELNIKLKPSGG